MPVTMLLGNKADMTSERKVNRLKADEVNPVINLGLFAQFFV